MEKIEKEAAARKPEILFVDDDRFFSNRYSRHLKVLFEVHRIQYAGDVRGFIDSHPGVELVILDIMMPTPKGVASSATNDGMDTGLWLLKDLSNEFVQRKLPVLVFTNRDYGVVSEQVKEMNLPPGLVLIRTKGRRTSARELPKIASQHLCGFSKERKQRENLTNG